ncbi:glucosaminyl-phosphatidylinositol-acyltransferase PIGW-like [Saccoglossus kowalevskii]|uniref:Phosphatidylinositol-glycan biosynthesis class W protein n=1 Tax=Saccoglossus kowalevskii TaxID=10224 RepID=A0ABM0M9A4_SACKO|nr:PREDICTED: phosphatidylinositol-glycan biosynthesis class W protein-like [Saccoglossus kowalevskii]
MLGFTILDMYHQVILITLLCIVIGLFVTADYAYNKPPAAYRTFSEVLQLNIASKKPFISNYRAYANIATAIAILGVDFIIFPRRFAKTETYGSGLMDVGVSGFIIANAIVSPEARGKYKEASGFDVALRHMLRSVKSTSPLLVLGLARLLSVKATDYHEHITEYGVHWNFFFTLAAVRVLSTLCLTFISVKISWVISLVVAIGYQYLLTNHGLEHFILHGSDGKDTREGFLNANREGIISSLGYVALYFAGVQLGRFFFQPRFNVLDWCKAFLILCVVNIVLWILLPISTEYTHPISRRVCNLSFIVWSLLYCIHLLTGFLLVDLITLFASEMGFIRNSTPRTKDHKDDPNTATVLQDSKYCLIASINRNQLLYFLLGNVMTGIINGIMKTILAPPHVAFVVLSSYMFILSFVHVILHALNITTKVW